MAEKAPQVVSRLNVPHYEWAEVCDGWRLIDSAAVRVIEERVPPGAKERRHHHKIIRQFFYILDGEAVMEIEGGEHVLKKGAGIEVPPGMHHQFMNRSASDVVFLVTSVPGVKDDRIDDADA